MRCDRCSGQVFTKAGRDRSRGRRLTARSLSPFSRRRSPAEVIVVAVRWYRRHRPSYADVAAWLPPAAVRPARGRDGEGLSAESRRSITERRASAGRLAPEQPAALRMVRCRRTCTPSAGPKDPSPRLKADCSGRGRADHYRRLASCPAEGSVGDVAHWGRAWASSARREARKLRSWRIAVRVLFRNGSMSRRLAGT